MFKRRDKRSLWQVTRDLIYPRGGWARAFSYIKHRVRRLPDPPERIARGIFAGIFVTFTPFFGLHFFLAAFLAFLMRGNIIAALLATFFGNPVTFVFIAAGSLQFGHFLLGTRPTGQGNGLGRKFSDAGHDLWFNFTALFTDRVADWSHWSVFFKEVFYPYLIGGIFPGVLIGWLAYYLSVPLIRAYQNRRKGVLKAKIAALKDKAVKKPKDVSE
ncbi:DUF2062 domain-containing protein [Algirhabdus cladophorae]|uniref:DUF2062 domain-containing protein n=1 Tax=Algirhabdus cladophorae TaxID=3377108 RepID=UPI003B846BAA